MSYDGFRVSTCPTFEDNGLQLGRLLLGSDIGWGQDWFASDGDDRGNGGITTGKADDLGADKPGGTSYDEPQSNGLTLCLVPTLFAVALTLLFGSFTKQRTTANI